MAIKKATNMNEFWNLPFQLCKKKKNNKKSPTYKDVQPKISSSRQLTETMTLKHHF